MFKLDPHNILGERRLRPQPFLMRNLKYVKDHRHQLNSQISDTADLSRGNESGIRKLSLRARPFRCILPTSLLHKYRQKSSLPPKTTTLGKFRLWLSVETSGGENIAFSVRESNIRLWSKKQFKSEESREDLVNNYEVFDLSALSEFIHSFPSKLSVVFELYTHKANTDSATPLLRGEQLLLENYNNSFAFSGAAIPNGDFILLLNPTTKQQTDAKNPGMGLTKKPVKRAGASKGKASNSVITNLVDDDVGNKAMIDVTKKVGSDESMIQNLGPHQGIVTLNFTGSLDTQRPAKSDDMKKYKTEVLVECQYSSPAYPWWNGITRYDFICPWCLINWRRLGTLIFHFVLVHDNTKVAVEAVQETQDVKNRSGNILMLHLRVTPGFGVENTIPELPDGTTGSATENLTFNMQKFPQYPQNRTDNGARGTMREDLSLNMLSIGDSIKNTVMRDSNSVPTHAGMVRDLEWVTCENRRCRKAHHHAYAANENFCSEWCEIMQVNSGMLNVDNGTKADDEDVPMTAFAKPKRSIDFEKSLGDKTLYHTVSLTPFLKGHLDENGLDSEDEIDHSWRLRMVEDKIGSLETVCAKNRVLWTMWNRYAFENYKAPGTYAERYTRYSVEKFVLEYGPEIHRLKLRQHLAAFLKILHEHGSIDSEAIISIFLCLDGKKRLEQCKISSRPERRSVPDPK